MIYDDDMLIYEIKQITVKRTAFLVDSKLHLAVAFDSTTNLYRSIKNVCPIPEAVVRSPQLQPSATQVRGIC